jgi:hypothetical protein
MALLDDGEVRVLGGRVAGVGGRADIACIGRRSDRTDAAGEPAAAEVLDLAVPGTQTA